jgi:HSP20 family molecular chaperone IbpA
MSYYRYFDIPKNVDVNKIDANYKNGVLYIIVPKKTSNQKQITIK